MSDQRPNGHDHPATPRDLPPGAFDVHVPIVEEEPEE